MATSGLLKRKVFWNKGYDVITFVHDITNKFLSFDSNDVVDVVIVDLVTLAYEKS